MSANAHCGSDFLIFTAKSISKDMLEDIVKREAAPDSITYVTRPSPSHERWILSLCSDMTNMQNISWRKIML